MTRSRANLLLLIAGATWGMGFVAQAAAMDSIGPFLFIALRFLIATLVVLPFAVRESARARAARTSADFPVSATLPEGAWWRFSLIGVMLFLGMATQQVGLLTTTVTNSGFLTGLYVVFTPLLGILLFREQPHHIIWPAAALALFGIFLLSGGSLAGLVPGDGLTIISAVFWSLQVVLIARFVGETGRPLALSLTQFAVTALLAALCALIFETATVEGIVAAAPSIIYAGVFASGLAFTLQVIGQRYTTAPQAAIFLSAEAPFAALFGTLFRDEWVGLVGLAGCALILAAMLLTELVPMIMASRRSRRRAIAASEISS